MHPYRLIPRVLVQAEILKNKPRVQAVNEFSSFVSELFLYHLFDEDEDCSTHLMIAFASLSFYKLLLPSLCHACETAHLAFKEDVINPNDSYANQMFLMADNIQMKLKEEYEGLAQEGHLQHQILYQNHYLRVFMFCHYLMFKALTLPSQSNFRKVLEIELKEFVVQEFGSIPWTNREIFAFTLSFMGILLAGMGGIILIPTITQLIVGLLLIQYEMVIFAGALGILIGAILYCLSGTVQEKQELHYGL